MQDPYITINKRMFEELVDSIPARLQDQMRVFMFHLLYNANYADKGTLKRGQLFITTTVLNLSEQTIRSLLGHLKSNEQVTSRSTNRGRVLTIVNYDSWVMSRNKSNDQSNGQVTTTEVINITVEPTSSSKKQKKKGPNPDVETVIAHATSLFDSDWLDGDTRKAIWPKIQKHGVDRVILGLNTFREKVNNGGFEAEVAANGATWFFRKRLEVVLRQTKVAPKEQVAPLTLL